MLVHHCRLLMKTHLFNRALDDTGILSIKTMRGLSAAEVGDLEVLLQSLQSFCTDLHDGIGGLTNVLKHQPYADDLTFCSEVQVSLCDPVNQFLEQTYRRLGQLAPKLLPFVQPSQAPASHQQQNAAADVKMPSVPLPGFSVHLAAAAAAAAPQPPASPPLADEGGPPIATQGAPNSLSRPPSVASNLGSAAANTPKPTMLRK